ncbi:MAG: DNA methyltransferase [Myxococcota bacterium]
MDGWRNRLYWGDNLQVMSHLLREFRGKVKLIYIDPPFDSKADYKKRVELRGQTFDNDRTSFEEKQYSDIWNNDEYLQFMFERLVLLRELLAPDGAVFVHVGPKVVHLVRMVVEEVFGPRNFLNHVIWSYRRWPSRSKAWQSMHDDILVYAKQPDAERTFHLEYEEPSDSYLKRFGGKTQVLDQETGTRKITVDEPTKGMPIRDVWDISIVAGSKAERVGYPTQKPEALVERIIGTCSDPGDLVFDAFMGSGTTQAVAMKLGRRFLGCDINLGALETTTMRLLQAATDLNAPRQPQLGDAPPPTLYTGFDVYTVNHYDVFRNPAQAKDLLMDALGVEPMAQSVFDGQIHLTRDGRDERRNVKILPVDRIATRSDLSELLHNLPYKDYVRRAGEGGRDPVERLTLVCMGHEPDLRAVFVQELATNLSLHAKEAERLFDVEVVDILRAREDLQFKRDAEAHVVVRGGRLVVEAFYPLNLLQKLSVQKQDVGDWRELVDAIKVDFYFDGAVLNPQVVDVPEGKTALVKGEYPVPKDAGRIRVKITDLLSESLEIDAEVVHA